MSDAEERLLQADLYTLGALGAKLDDVARGLPGTDYRRPSPGWEPQARAPEVDQVARAVYGVGLAALALGTPGKDYDPDHALHEAAHG